MMHRLAAFSGIKVLTYCILDNHFHILVEVPEQDGEMPDEEVVRRMRFIHDRHTTNTYKSLLQRARKQGDKKKIEKLRKLMMYRMENLSEYMKALKQRFSTWYNRTHGRRGTLWEERFKSVLIEPPDALQDEISNGPCVLMAVANYIDLNPVRAKITDDPKEYRWCGLAEAAAGKAHGSAGLRRLLELKEGRQLCCKEALALYRRSLYLEGDFLFSAEKVRGIMRSGGVIATHELIRCHVRYFNDGLVLGHRSFVDDFFSKRRELFGKKRKTGARHLTAQSFEGLCAIRDLKKEAVARM